MSDKGPYIVFYILAIVLVASSLVGMRQPIGKTMKMVLAWVGIFAFIFILFAFRSELTAFGQRLRAEMTGTPIVAGEAVRIPVSEDGHFWVDARLNGEPVRFMVDSGASVTTVSRAAAEAARLTISTDRVVVSTANGRIWVNIGRADELEVGSIRRTDFPVTVNAQDDTNLLGMNFLASLSGWRVEGNYLVLVP